MSKVAPNNATIELKSDEDGRQYIHKKYHAKYTSAEELYAYQQLNKCLSNKNSGIRAAQVYDVNDLDNSLNIEFVNYKNLHEILFSGNVNVLITIQDKLLNLFDEARRQHIRFDSDPSNMLCDEIGVNIVLVDPICVNLKLDDFTAVVFIWGLIKLSLRNPRVWQTYKILKICFDYYRKYIAQTGICYKTFNRQIGIYIGVAISWNLEKNAVEGFITRLFRLVMVVPLYSVVRVVFKYNLIRPSLNEKSYF